MDKIGSVAMMSIRKFSLPLLTEMSFKTSAIPLFGISLDLGMASSLRCETFNSHNEVEVEITRSP